LNRLSRAHERYRRQTDDRQTDDRQTDERQQIANVNSLLKIKQSESVARYQR